MATAAVQAEKHVSDFWENTDKEWNWIHFWVDAQWSRIACFDGWVLCFNGGLSSGRPQQVNGGQIW